MAAGGTGMDEGIPQPLHGVGCQDLLENCTVSGWLRKRHMINRLKIFLWPRAYVVLSEGCLYYFANEYSRTAAGKFSLYGFNGVYRASEVLSRDTKWALKVVHTHPDEFKTYYFSAGSEREMKMWMKEIKCELIIANGKNLTESIYADYLIGNGRHQKKGKKEEKDLLEYKELETAIYDDPTKLSLPKEYSKHVKRHDEDSDDEDLPTDNDPACRPPVPPPRHGLPDILKDVPGTRPRPPARDPPKINTPKSPDKGVTISYAVPDRVLLPERKSEQKKGTKESASKNKNKHSASKQVGGGSKETTTNADDVRESYWAAIYYWEQDTDKASEIIRSIGEDGVYLVREGNEPGSKVLIVYAEHKSRKYKLTASEAEDGQILLGLCNEGPFFPTVEDLMYNYYTEKLPTVECRLQTPYKLHPLYKP